MAFVRTKKVKCKEYYQLVESHRLDDEPRQRVLVHLGHHPNVDTAIGEWSKEIRRLRRQAARERESAAERPEGSRAYRAAMEQADTADARADRLKANLKKLRDLRKKGCCSA